MKIYETKVGAGMKQWLEIPVDEECSLKAAAFCGSRPGKRLIVTAGVHGCEYIGILAVSRLIQELDPRQMKGEVVFLPIANEGGFYKEIKQLVPEDGVNLNRAFPGTEMGSRSAKIAAAVETYLYPGADFLVDLHSGDIHEMVVPFAFFPVAAGETVEKEAAASARAMSLSWRVASTAKNGLYSWAAQKGIPALLLERGGLGRWTEREVDAYRINLYELLVHLDILPESILESVKGMNLKDSESSPESEVLPSGKIEQREIRIMRYLEAPGNGFWYPAIREGSCLKKGDLLGEIRRLDGSLMYRYESELDGMVFYYTLSLGVSEGEPLVAYGEC